MDPKSSSAIDDHLTYNYCFSFIAQTHCRNKAQKLQHRDELMRRN